MLKGYYEEHYGMKLLGLGEEIKLSENERLTRRCKCEIIDWCKWMKQYVEQLEDCARRIPVEDDERHAEMVRRLRDKVKTASLAIETACFYHGEDVSLD